MCYKNIFTAAINYAEHSAHVFVTVNHYHPSLIFMAKVKSLPLQFNPIWVSK